MPPEFASFVLDIVLPVLGTLATVLLGLLTFTCQRILKKFDEVCVELRDSKKELAVHDMRISVLERSGEFHEQVCALRHKVNS